ncbi:MAG: carbon-nitrogen hydrolase family protein [Clostridiaceae bacterium]|jgi:predicted amidohydrolase|nr:carbon-nitrogen hydrolase family protein [Clostridiaceae bacterium]
MIITKYKVAGVQAGPVYMDLKRSVDKACGYIREAAHKGAMLIAFPESFLPGFPQYIGIYNTDELFHFRRLMYDNALEIGSSEFKQLSRTARENGIYVCISANERENNCIYLSQMWFDDEGNFMGKCRKMKGTTKEKLAWSDGDGSVVRVFDTKIGKLGGIQCGNHNVHVNVAALCAMGIQVHVASWPSSNYDNPGYDNYRFYANSTKYVSICNRTFTIMANQVLNDTFAEVLSLGDEELKKRIPEIMEPGRPEIYGGGFSAVYNPYGEVISNTLAPNEEGLVIADIDLDDTINGKLEWDYMGQNGSPEVLSITIDQTHYTSANFIGKSSKSSISYDEIQFDSVK